jgi:hypothetical protein
MRQPVQTNGVTLRNDAPQKVGMSPRLIPQTKPCGRGTEIRAEFQGPVRDQRQTALEAVQGLGLVIGRAAELEPVLPIQGKREPGWSQVKFRSERLMNSREKSSSSVWNCFSWPWKKL